MSALSDAQEGHVSIASKPVIAQWYRYPDKGYEFQVTAIDDQEKTVEIQYFDGDLDEVELHDWYQMQIEPIGIPEDWTGTADNVADGNSRYAEHDLPDADWTGLPEDEPDDNR